MPLATLLDRLVFVLVEPSHPGNVGSAARALRAMGLRHLAVVAPRFPGVATLPDAVAFASGADDVLASCREYARLEDALADTTLAVAVSAAGREFGPPPQWPGEASRAVLTELAADPARRVALVFGAERTGLSVAQVQLCQALVTIPTDPDFSSLNLAQAVQVMAWEFRQRVLEGAPRDVPEAPEGLPEAPSPQATHARIEAFLDHFEEALVAVRFLDPAHPKKLMPRLRRLFARARPQAEEIDLLRGVCKQMLLAAHGKLPGGPGSRP